MNVFPMFLLASVLLGVAAYLLWTNARTPGRNQPRFRKRVRVRQSLLDYVRDSLQAAGVPMDTGSIVLCVAVATALGIVASVIFDIWHGPIILLLVLLAINTLIKYKVARLRNGITRQMPGFLDQLNRDMSSGQGLDISFRRAVSCLDRPLRPVLERGLNRVNMGQDLDAGIRHEADLLKSFELELLATIVGVNLRHGGSVRHAIESFINMLRQDERNKSDLRAMTGETRVTAWVLGLVPIGVVALMLVGNPDFLESMLASEGGQKALCIAVVLQVTGVFLLYRMLKVN